MVFGLAPNWFTGDHSAAMWATLVEYFITFSDKLQTFFANFQTFKAKLPMSDGDPVGGVWFGVEGFT